MEEVRNLNNVYFKHLSVSYDEEKDLIIYGRKLLDGPGDTLYGLEIAQFLIKDVDFIKDARSVRNKLIEQGDELVENKRSKYNVELVVEKCVICGKNNMMTELHTHHLKEQNEYSEEIMNIDGVRKNQLGNLVVLCEDHHEETHHGNLVINGWIDTTEGRKLDYYYKKEEVEEEIKEEDNYDWIEGEIKKMKSNRMEDKFIIKMIHEKAKKKGEKWTKKDIEKKMKEREDNLVVV